MILEDSKILINDSRELLQEIESLYLQDISIGYDSPMLRVRIKQFLENINSALDYAAFSVFTEYCAERVKQEKPHKFVNIEKNVYFPCKQKKEGQYGFDKYIDERFPFLKEEKPEVVEIFSKYQPFPTKSKWLFYLKELVNENKHRFLLRQNIQHTNVINHLTASNGTVIDSIAIITPDGSLPFRFLNEDGSEGTITSYDGEKIVELIFPKINTPVLPTIKRIIRSAPTIISDLEKLV